MLRTPAVQRPAKPKPCAISATQHTAHLAATIQPLLGAKTQVVTGMLVKQRIAVRSSILQHTRRVPQPPRLRRRPVPLVAM